MRGLGPVKKKTNMKTVREGGWGGGGGGGAAGRAAVGLKAGSGSVCVMGGSVCGGGGRARSCAKRSFTGHAVGGRIGGGEVQGRVLSARSLGLDGRVQGGGARSARLLLVGPEALGGALLQPGARGGDPHVPGGDGDAPRSSSAHSSKGRGLRGGRCRHAARGAGRCPRGGLRSRPSSSSLARGPAGQVGRVGRAGGEGGAAGGGVPAGEGGAAGRGAVPVGRKTRRLGRQNLIALAAAAASRVVEQRRAERRRSGNVGRGGGGRGVG